MPTIDIIIRNKTASAVNPPCIVCGNSDYNVKFDFDDEWQAHNNKIGVFAYNRCGEWRSENVLFEGDTCPVPALHGVRSVWIGVTAGDVRTSTPADVPCRMGATDFSDTTEKPSADIWGQILDKLDTVGTVQRINTVISYDADRGGDMDHSRGDHHHGGYIHYISYFPGVPKSADTDRYAWRGYVRTGAGHPKCRAGSVHRRSACCHRKNEF